jgi:hypothetical protein
LKKSGKIVVGRKKGSPETGREGCKSRKPRQPREKNVVAQDRGKWVVRKSLGEIQRVAGAAGGEPREEIVQREALSCPIQLSGNGESKWKMGD